MSKIIWALDITSEKNTLQKMTERLVRLSRNGKTKIMPVYVFSPEQVNNYSILSPNAMKSYLPPVKKAMSKILKNVKIKGLESPKILVQPYPSTRRTTEELLKYAKKQKADLIVLSTHSRKGASRLFIGSFAETLLLQSKIPLILVTPTSKTKTAQAGIFFPTDLSKASKKALPKIIQFAKDRNKKLTIYHAKPPEALNLVAVGTFAGRTGWPMLESGPDKGELKNELQKMVQKAKDGGVKADYVLEQARQSIPGTIVKAAQKNKASTIAMVTQLGPFEAALTGSFTRQVIRNSPLDLWVIQSKS